MLDKIYKCAECSWSGTEPSITDASSVIERDGRLEVDRTHLLVCPACFTIINQRNTKTHE